MAVSSEKTKSTDAKSHSEEPQFDELSNTELDDVQGAGACIKIGDVKGTSKAATREDTKGISILATNFKST